MPYKNEADHIESKAGTVIIDNTLLEVSQENRYRFTVGHECRHSIAHIQYHVKEHPNQISFLQEAEDIPAVRCRIYTNNRNSRKEWDDYEWMEWQANYFSAAILMPKSMVLKLYGSANKRNLSKNLEAHFLASQISETFNVSIAGATHRLEDLKIIDKGTINLQSFITDFLDLT